MGRHQENDDEPIIKVTSVKKDFSTYIFTIQDGNDNDNSNENTFTFLYNVTYIQDTQMLYYIQKIIISYD